MHGLAPDYLNCAIVCNGPKRTVGRSILALAIPSTRWNSLKAYARDVLFIQCMPTKNTIRFVHHMVSTTFTMCAPRAKWKHGLVLTFPGFINVPIDVSAHAQ